jgi:hypothetical protein
MNLEYHVFPKRLRDAIARDKRLGESHARRLNTLHQIRILINYTEKQRVA